MALTDENGGGIPATMLVGPATFGNTATAMPYYPMPMMMGGMGGGGGMSNGWGDGAWIILLIIVLLAAGGGWGNNNAGFFRHYLCCFWRQFNIWSDKSNRCRGQCHGMVIWDH